MKKLLLLSFLTSSSLFSMQLDVVKYKANKTHIDSSATFVPERLGKLDLYRSDKGFFVHKNDEKHHINKHFTDPILRDMDKKQLKGFLKNGYLAVNQMDNGEYSLKAKGRVEGGGAVGAAIGVFLGKAAVSIAGHGAIQIVGVLSGPFYWPVVIGLESCLGAQIEAASLAGAVAGGIALGVATGPV